METMIAMMIVTVAMSTFMSVYAFTQMNDGGEPEVSIDFLTELELDGTTLVGLDDEFVDGEVSKRGYVSMTIVVTTVGTVKSYLRLGEYINGCDQIIRNGTMLIYDQEGRRHAAVYEVIAFV